MTTILCYEDSYLKTFDADVVAVLVGALIALFTTR